MENKKIHYLMLFVFLIFGLINFFLIKNNIITDNLKLLFFCFLMILTLGVSHGALDHLRGKNCFNLYLRKIGLYFFIQGTFCLV